MTFKELDPKFLFHTLEQPGQRRLLDPEPLGGTRQVAFFGNGDDGMEMSEFDHSILLRYDETFPQTLVSTMKPL